MKRLLRIKFLKDIYRKIGIKSQISKVMRMENFIRLFKIFHFLYLILNIIVDKCFRRKIKDVKNILLSAEAGIGDLLMFTPTIKVIRRSFPKAWICMVVASRGSKEVVFGDSLVDEIIEYDQKDKEIIKRLQRYNFDLGFTATPSMGWRTALLMYRCKIRVKVGHPFYSRFKLGPFPFKGTYPYNVHIEKGLHYVEQNLNLARRIGLKVLDSDKKYVFYLSKENKDFAAKYFKNNKLSGVLAVHPGCHKLEAHRRWDKFDQFINEFQKRYPEFDMLVFIGPDEIDIKNTLDIHWNDKIHIVDNISLKDAAALLELCKVLVSSDSGMAHIACAVGIKTVTIFGPAYPHLSRPFLNNIVISAGLPCQPCGDEEGCRDDIKCVSTVSVADVIEKTYSCLRSLSTL